MKERPTFIEEAFRSVAQITKARTEALMLAFGQLDRAEQIRNETRRLEAIGEKVGNEDYARRKRLHEMEAEVAKLTGDPTEFPPFESIGVRTKPLEPSPRRPRIKGNSTIPETALIARDNSLTPDEKRLLIRSATRTVFPEPQDEQAA
jgi:hypothetical protein